MSDAGEAIKQLKFLCSTIQPSNPWYLPMRNKDICLHRDTHTNVHSSFLHNTENLASWIFAVGEWINKWCSIYIMKYCWAIERNGLLVTWNNMNEFQKHYATWKTLGMKRLHITWNPRKSKTTVALSRSVVTGDGVGGRNWLKRGWRELFGLI